jgi:hypothetical protein
MRTLSLWQPWASLIALGEKKIETRHWTTDYRGPLFIHAAKSGHGKPTRVQAAMGQAFTNEIISATLAAHDITGMDQLPLGAILCTVRLLWTRPTDHVMADPEMKDQLTSRELAFGDYSSGRFAWGLELVEVFPKPFPVRGHQGFWQWERPQVEALI